MAERYLIGNVKGPAGFSPSAKIEQNAQGAEITITDINGTTSAQINHGDSPVLTAGEGIAIRNGVISNTRTVPTKVSQLDNDSNYVGETEMNNALANKQDTLIAGTNVVISGNVISAVGSSTQTLVPGLGININNDTVSIDESVVATRRNLMDYQKSLIAGDNITIAADNTISADVEYNAGYGIDISQDKEISVNLTIPTDLGELTNNAGYIKTENDPVFNASPAHNITQNDIDR